MCLTTYADSLERWPVGVDAACVLLVSLALFFNRVRQVILNLLEKGGHAHTNLEDLSLVHALFDGAGCNEAVYVDVLLLAITPHTSHCLAVDCW